MTVQVKQQAVYRIWCDAEGCAADFFDESWSDRAIRSTAEVEGWQVRPNAGKGSRSAPDLCPKHAEKKPEAQS